MAGFPDRLRKVAELLLTTLLLLACPHSLSGKCVMPSYGTYRAAVSTTAELSLALANAAPGDLIDLADGEYEAPFTATKSGTAEKPITLCGSARAILTGRQLDRKYVLYLNTVSYWNVIGITITMGKKGIMLDTSTYCNIDGVTVWNIGQEAVHFRTNSAHNTIANSWIYKSGQLDAKYGEGVYIGTAVSNGKDDASNYNVVANCRFGPQITAECVDIKEFTSNNIVIGCQLDGSGQTGNFADSWIDVKGNSNLIRNNFGSTTILDGFQTHEVVHGFGLNNTFDGNQLVGSAPGYVVRPQGAGKQTNIVYCTNDGSAALGVSSVPCSQGGTAFNAATAYPARVQLITGWEASPGNYFVNDTMNGFTLPPVAATSTGSDTNVGSSGLFGSVVVFKLAFNVDPDTIPSMADYQASLVHDMATSLGVADSRIAVVSITKYVVSSNAIRNGRSAVRFATGDQSLVEITISPSSNRFDVTPSAALSLLQSQLADPASAFFKQPTTSRAIAASLVIVSNGASDNDQGSAAGGFTTSASTTIMLAAFAFFFNGA